MVSGFSPEAADIRETYQRYDLFSNYPSGLPARTGAPPMIPEDLDPPDHTKYRRAISGMFSPRRVHQLEQDIRTLAGSLVADLRGREEIDFVAGFAVPLPTRVFIRRLDLPLDQAQAFVDWNNSLLHALGEEKQRANAEVGRYLRDLVAERAADPRDDWISELLAARVDGLPLSQPDVVGVTFLLFLAGLETVTAALTFSFNFLARNPEYRDQLVRRPDLAPQATEELLRYFSFTNIPRAVTTDMEFAGVSMKTGDRVLLCNSFVSRSPDENVDAGLVEFSRPSARHSAFGLGPHRCLGSHLARLELSIALETWHRHITDYAVATDMTLGMWGGTNMAIKALPLRLGRLG